MKKHILFFLILLIFFAGIFLSVKNEHQTDSISEKEIDVKENITSDINQKVSASNPEKSDLNLKYEDVKSFFDNGKIDKYCKKFGFDSGGIEANRNLDDLAKLFCLYQNGNKIQVEYFRLDDFVMWANNEK